MAGETGSKWQWTNETEVLFAQILGTFRFEYEYEIGYKYDFSNPVCVL